MPITHYLIPMIPYLSLKFELVSKEHAYLTSFKGSLIRGAFGHALRRIVCVMGMEQACIDCLLNRQCVYTNVFETFIFKNPPRFLRGLHTSPKPFVMYMLDQKRNYPPETILEFEMSLVGQAIDYHPFVIYAVQQMAEQGLGAKRFKFHLKNVFYKCPINNWQLLYNGLSKTLITFPPASYINQSPPLISSLEELTIQFLSPTRIRFEDELRMNFTFRQLLFKMIRRILELAHFYAPDSQIDWEFHNLLIAASNVKLRQNKLYWIDLKRYSNRQKAKMKFGGFVGKILLQGDLLPFIHILKASEILHVGKATTFGLGKIKIGEI